MTFFLSGSIPPLETRTHLCRDTIDLCYGDKCFQPGPIRIRRLQNESYRNESREISGDGMSLRVPRGEAPTVTPLWTHMCSRGNFRHKPTMGSRMDPRAFFSRTAKSPENPGKCPDEKRQRGCKRVRRGSPKVSAGINGISIGPRSRGKFFLRQSFENSANFMTRSIIYAFIIANITVISIMNVLLFANIFARSA